MPCSRKILVAIGFAAVLCGSLLAATAPGKKDRDKDKDKEKDKPKPAQVSKPEKKADGKKPESKKSDDQAPANEKQPTKLVIPLPKGQDSKGVTIPYTDASGRKTMLFKIGLGTRVDDDNVKMHDLIIETFTEDGAQEMTVALPSSMLNLGTRIITGDQKVTINRSDFQITGKNMEFNTETRTGWIKGDVKMIIYDLSQEAATTPGASKAASSNPNPTGS
jgi:Lipopolysaccharide-assembly, LptC-related